MENQGTKKSIFKRPERLASLALVGGLFTLIGIYILPFVTLALTNTIYFGIMLAIAGFLGIILLNKRLWQSFFYLSDLFAKKAMGFVIQMDPFIIAEQHIHKMEEQKEIFYEQSKLVDKQKELLNKKIAERVQKIEHLNNRSLAADKNQMPEEAALSLRQKEKLESGLNRLIPLRDGLTNMGNNLEKIYKNIGFVIEEKKFDLEENKDLYNSLTAGSKALSTAMKIFNGDPDENLNLQMSMDALNDDMAEKLAGMKRDYATITNFTKSVDLDNAAYEMAAMKKLENLETNKLQISALKDRAREKVPVRLRAAGQIDKSSHAGLLE